MSRTMPYAIIAAVREACNLTLPTGACPFPECTCATAATTIAGVAVSSYAAGQAAMREAAARSEDHQGALCSSVEHEAIHKRTAARLRAIPISEMEKQ